MYACVSPLWANDNVVTLSTIQKSIEIDPDYGEVYFNLGNLLSDEYNFAEAAIK